MKWLITIRPDTDLERLRESLGEWGCEVSSLAPINLDQDQVLEVEGPSDLPELVRNEEVIVDIAPNSTMSYF